MTVHYRIEVNDRVLANFAHGFRTAWTVIHVMNSEQSEDVPKHIEKLAMKEFNYRKREVRIDKFHSVKKYCTRNGCT